MTRKEDLQKLISQHNRRRQILKERQARQGIETPPSVITEIEDTHDCRHYRATQAARDGTPVDRLQNAGGGGQIRQCRSDLLKRQG